MQGSFTSDPLSISPAALTPEAPSNLDLSAQVLPQEPASNLDLGVLDLTEKANAPQEDILELTDNLTTDRPMTAENPAAAENSGALISEQAATAATEALSKLLVGNVAVERDGVTAKVTLEDMTRELMKPMLKAWLDQNLPAIIEKVVQREVEKLSRRAADV